MVAGAGHRKRIETPTVAQSILFFIFFILLALPWRIQKKQKTKQKQKKQQQKHTEDMQTLVIRT